MAFIKIDGVPLPPVTKYELPMNDLDGPNTKRTEAGYLTRDRIRANIYKIDVAWVNITNDEIALISEAVSPASFNVELYDPSNKGSTVYVTKKMFSSAEKRKVLKFFKNETESYWDFAFSLTEF